MRSAECGVLSGERRDAHDLPGQTPHSALRIMFSEMPHLYLHVPFCARRCSYCDFSIAVRKRVPAEEYVVLIQRELELVRAADPGPSARGLIGNDAGPLLFEPRGTLKDSLSVAAPGRDLDPALALEPSHLSL